MKPEKPIPEATHALAVRIGRHVNLLAGVTLVLAVLFVFIAAFPEVFERAFMAAAPEEMVTDVAPVTVDEGIENGIHVESGLIVDTNWELVQATCTACHSAKLVTQNRADSAGWTRMIQWMQETQNLWDLGDNEALIVAYLAKNYPPRKKGRRARLTNIEWYDLEP
jgi:hypothetical protein